jgi:hypothetical protein
MRMTWVIGIKVGGVEYRLKDPGQAMQRERAKDDVYYRKQKRRSRL